MDRINIGSTSAASGAIRELQYRSNLGRSRVVFDLSHVINKSGLNYLNSEYFPLTLTY